MDIFDEDESAWSLGRAAHPLLSLAVALLYGLYMLSYPPRYRKLSICLLALPLSYAFRHHLDATPWYNLSDTFGRFLYIWFFHMSNVIAILEHAPTPVKDSLSLRERVSQAYAVLFCIRLETPAQRRQNAAHSYSRLGFLLYHAARAGAYYGMMQAWEFYTAHWSMAVAQYVYTASRVGPVFVYLDASLALFHRLEIFVEWNVIMLYMYEAIYSGFAALLVGVLALDEPQDWRLALCGPLSEAWNVRRYWGKHWHSYVYLSFTAHTKVVTRGWCGMKRGRLETRIVENTMVFALSGMAHSAVRWAQDPVGDYWAIALWYVGQMVPILLEGVIQELWRRVKMGLGIKPDDRRMNAVERMVGYAWMMAWFMWSIPEYARWRVKWSKAKMWKLYGPIWAQEFRQRDEAQALRLQLANVTMSGAEPTCSLIRPDLGWQGIETSVQ
ncbi:hypothetical protein ACN47E_005535 [Coniothyrium glycines]